MDDGNKREFILFWIIGILLFYIYTGKAQADNSQGYWLFGDSLSSEHNSWASQLDDLDFAHIQNVAQAGSRLVDTTLPRQLSCKNREVILWLGTNDAGSGVSQSHYTQRLNDHLSFLRSRRCVVWLVLPVVVNLGPSTAERTTAARSWTVQTAASYTNTIVIDAPYNASQTVDGLHPTTGAHFWLAVWFAHTLGMRPE